MRHRIDGRKLGRTGGHRRALYRNLVTDLLKHGKITTTEAKAKEVRGLAEKMITLGKKSGLLIIQCFKMSVKNGQMALGSVTADKKEKI